MRPAGALRRGAKGTLPCPPSRRLPGVPQSPQSRRRGRAAVRGSAERYACFLGEEFPLWGQPEPCFPLPVGLFVLWPFVLSLLGFARSFQRAGGRCGGKVAEIPGIKFAGAATAGRAPLWGLRPRAMSLYVTRPRDGDGFTGAGGDASAGGAAGAPWGAAPPRAAAGPLGAAGNPRPCGRHRDVRTLLVHRGRDGQGTDRAETGREVTATEDF